MEGVIIPDIDDTSMDLDIDTVNAGCRFPRRHSKKSKKLCAKEERNASIKRVSVILQKSEAQRTLQESQMLHQCSDAVEEVQLRWRKRDEAKKRLEEFEEPPDILREKCQILAQAIAQSQHLVCYTGAGISTAARIPDYRGPNGIWTRLQQGKDIGNHDLSLAEPTYTHMALSQLYHQNILKYVVSQNCDGLHLRSGLPRDALSELHGNMYIEVCKSCKPAREYWRLFDVTENTARYSHKTMRKCYVCHEPLVDTIVHFGERGTLQWPLNWSGASKNAQKATTILCLGSSLKVLKRYPWLWQMDKPAKKRPNLYIVNLQWTPKDDCANVKIHGKCDVVMKTVMNFLGISVRTYNRIQDPIFYHATHLCEEEMHTTTQPTLKCDDISLLDDDTQAEKAQSNLQNCDSTCNIQNSIKDNKPSSGSSSYDVEPKVCTPPSLNNVDKQLVKKQDINIKKCSFSIDSILHDNKFEDTKKTINLTDVYSDLTISSSLFNNGLFLPQNYHAFVAYYHFTDALLLQNPLLRFQDMLYYPYQTSLLYSGLHNIINPSSHFPNNTNPFKINTSVRENPKVLDNHKTVIKQEGLLHRTIMQPEVVACKFCCKEAKSSFCLFYTKSLPVFLKQSVAFKKKSLLCLCCEYSTDEEDDDKKDKGLDETVVKEEKDEIEGGEKEQIKVKIQAGWFGKGYRKIKRMKKK